jgi:hypothetical protein
VKESNEFSVLLIILLKKSSAPKQIDNKVGIKQYELYNTFNPRFFEIIIPLKEAKLKVDSSDIIYSSKYNIFRPW